jgi:hypothetical protein
LINTVRGLYVTVKVVRFLQTEPQVERQPVLQNVLIVTMSSRPEANFLQMYRHPN